MGRLRGLGTGRGLGSVPDGGGDWAGGMSWVEGWAAEQAALCFSRGGVSGGVGVCGGVGDGCSDPPSGPGGEGPKLPVLLCGGGVMDCVGG